MSHKLSQVQAELSEERQMSEALRQNQKDWQVKVSKLEGEMLSLKEEKQKVWKGFRKINYNNLISLRYLVQPLALVLEAKPWNVS